MDWDTFEALKEGSIFTVNGIDYIKVEQSIRNHLEGCVIRLTDGKILHVSHLF